MKIRRTAARWTRLLLSCSALSGLAAPGFSQEAGELKIEPVIVTAERRSESLQSVPVAATAANEQMIRERGLADPQDLTRIAPSVDIWSSLGESQPKITIRGIGSSNFEQTTESTAAIYFDEAPITPSPAKLPQFFDLERVEVLRGPQGTLYGKNTTGGAINLISRRPGGQAGGYASLTAGRYGQLDLEGALETPLAEGLSMRTSLRRQYRDGYGTDLSTGEDIYDKDSLAGRIGLAYEGADLSAYFKLWRHRSRADGFYTRTRPTEFDDGDTTTPAPTIDAHLVTGHVPNADPYREFFNDQKSDIDNWGLTANLDHRFERATLSLVLGYVDSRQDQDHDCDGSDFLLCQIDFVMKVDAFSGEIRLASELDGPFNFVLGTNYFSDSTSLDNTYQSLLFPVLTGAGEHVTQVISQETVSHAAFIDASYELQPGLELLAGLRWTRDEKDYLFDAYFSPRPDPAALVIAFADSRTWRELTYRLGLAWTPRDTINVYATVSRGYRSGAYPGGFLPADFGPVNPEFVDNYELGFKSFLMDQRVQFNAAVFHMKFEDQQLLATLPGDISPALINAGRSEVTGLEIEGLALISEQISLGYSAAFLDTGYKEFFRGPRSLAGEPLANAPEMKITLSPEHRAPFRSGEFFAAADVTHVSRQRVGNDYDLLGRDIQPSYQRLDARIGWRGQNLDAFIWGRNLTDETILRDWLDLTTLGFVQELYDEPAAYGVTVSRRF